MPKIIYGHLPKAEKQQFSDYANELGFKASEIAKFLVLRELRLGQLDQLGVQTKGTEVRSERDKITVHLPSNQIKMYFEVQAKECGMSLSHALVTLIRRELKERKFESALSN